MLICFYNSSDLGEAFMKKQYKKENDGKNYHLVQLKGSFRGLPGDRDSGRNHNRHEMSRHRSAQVRAFIEGFLS